MRLTRRPSGGRGEYEISEATPEGVTPHDLIGLRLLLDFGEGIVVDSDATLRHQGGKFRVRLLDEAAIHPHRQIAAALMMPHAVREDRHWGRGAPVMRADQYSVQHVALDYVQLGPTDALLRLGDLTLRNASHDAHELRLAPRLEAVRTLWQNADRFPDNVKALIERHEALVTAGTPIPEEAEKIIEQLQEIVTEARDEFGVVYRTQAEDVVPDLLRSLQFADAPPEPPQPVDDVPPEEFQIRQRVIKDWKRWVSYRGAKSAKFRQTVRRAYNSTCLVCGLHLPPTAFNLVAGVDAAHILPWADYDLDEVHNGICLCKHHHWAFDEGLILITWDGTNYNVEVPAEIVAEIRRANPAFSVDELLAHAGPIPAARLPSRASDRPHPDLLRLFAEKLRGDGA